MPVSFIDAVKLCSLKLALSANFRLQSVIQFLSQSFFHDDQDYDFEVVQSCI